jgi:hypothetical protein
LLGDARQWRDQADDAVHLLLARSEGSAVIAQSV